MSKKIIDFRSVGKRNYVCVNSLSVFARNIFGIEHILSFTCIWYSYYIFNIIWKNSLFHSFLFMSFATMFQLNGSWESKSNNIFVTFFSWEKIIIISLEYINLGSSTHNNYQNDILKIVHVEESLPTLC